MPEAAGETVRDLRRGQILAAARRIVAERGLEALTFSALESSLDFTRGVITYHFKNKDEIVVAVLESAVDEIDRAMFEKLAATESLEDRIRAVLRGQVRGWIEHPEAGRILLSFWGRLRSDPRLARLNARIYARYRADSATLFGGRGDPDTLAALLVGTVIGIACQVYFDPGAVDPEAAIEEATRLFAAR